MAVTVVAHRAAAQPLRRRGALRHLQLPHGDGAGRARRGRCRDDRGRGRRRHLDRAVARRALPRRRQGGEAARTAAPAARASSIAVGAVLVYGSSVCPRSPIRRRRSIRMSRRAIWRRRCRETGVPNVVTAVLASYRGYDTLGETAWCSPPASGSSRCCAARREEAQMKRRPHPARRREAADAVHAAVRALRAVPRRLRPRRRLPGRRDRRRGDHVLRDHLRPRRRRSASCPSGWSKRCSPPACCSTPASASRASLLGGNYLDYFVLDHDPVHGQHRGIFWVEAGVALTVSG